MMLHTIDDMSVEQKRAALRTFVKRWVGMARMFMCIYLALMIAADLLKLRRILSSRYVRIANAIRNDEKEGIPNINACF